MNQYILATIITTSLINISTHAMYEEQTLIIYAYDTKSHDELRISMLYTHDKLTDPYETKKAIDPTPKHTLSNLEIHTALSKAIKKDDVTLAKSYYDQIPTPTEIFQLNCLAAAEKKGNADMIKMLFSHSGDNQKNLHANYIIRGAARHGHPDVIKLFPLSEYRFKIEWPIVIEIVKRYKQQKTEEFILDYLRINK